VPASAGAIRFDEAASMTWHRMTPCELCTSASADTTRRRHRRPGRAGAAVGGHDACGVHHDARDILDASA
jgi:hypothetical protein